MGILPACVSVFHKKARKWCCVAWSGAMEGFELPCRYWESTWVL